mgnify:CR=1 FL=1
MIFYLTFCYRYSKAQIEGSIKEEPYIENVVVKRKLPNKILVNVKERKTTYKNMFGAYKKMINTIASNLILFYEDLNSHATI